MELTLEVGEPNVQYDFEWDSKKAKLNRRKHGVSFEQAATVFHDSGALSLYDEEHSGTEDRWITLGLSTVADFLVVHHTFQEVDKDRVQIRVFSCRKATRKEMRQYRGES